MSSYDDPEDLFWHRKLFNINIAERPITEHPCSECGADEWEVAGEPSGILVPVTCSSCKRNGKIIMRMKRREG